MLAILPLAGIERFMEIHRSERRLPDGLLRPIEPCSVSGDSEFRAKLSLQCSRQCGLMAA
jgi:hypothetical protein